MCVQRRARPDCTVRVSNHKTISRPCALCGWLTPRVRNPGTQRADCTGAIELFTLKQLFFCDVAFTAIKKKKTKPKETPPLATVTEHTAH